MTDTTDLFEQVDRLLHDAEHADAGRAFAETLGHTAEAQQLRAKHDRLVAEARALDPERTAPAWRETSLDSERIDDEGDDEDDAPVEYSHTLRLLAYAPPAAVGRFADEYLFLAWDGQPPTASLASGEHHLHDVDLGDAACAALPTMPQACGLWLLTWAYAMVDDEDYGRTAVYAPTCAWTRPTLDELRALGALPAEGTAEEAPR